MLVDPVDIGEKVQVFPNFEFFVNAGDTGDDGKFGGWANPAKQASRSLLPEPEGPNITKISPLPSFRNR